MKIQASCSYFEHILIDILLSYYIPHDNCIHYRPIYYPLNPIIIFPYISLDHLHDQFNSPQCIMYIIIKLLCLWMSDIMTSQREKWVISSLLSPINRFWIRCLYIIFGNCNNGGSIHICPTWQPTVRLLLFII